MKTNLNSIELRPSRRAGLALWLFAFTVIVLPGCAPSDAELTDGNAGSATVKARPLPMFNFHKPTEIGVAINRLRELHDKLSGNNPLPDPIEYQVKEIVHGTGSSGHSHFYLHDPEETETSEFVPHDKDPFTGNAVGEDDHETSDEKMHDVKINPFAELKDLARWLPQIASDGDMPKDNWLKVNEFSKEITPKLYEIIEGSDDDEKRRSSYREISETMGGHILALEELVK